MRTAHRPPRLAVPRALGVVAELFEQLHVEGVAYCHWKGNARLMDAVSGAADLDVLVDRSASGTLGRILREAGFKLFTIHPGQAAPAIQDFLAVDAETGRLVHLHLHFQLVTGEHYLKGYRLPWEHLLLASRQLDRTWNLYVPDPSLEFVLHMVRAVLKVRTRDRLVAWAGHDYFSRAQRQEFEWLLARAQPDRVGEFAAQLLGAASSRALLQLMAAGATWSRFRTFEKRARPTLRLFRRYSTVDAAWHNAWRELGWLWGVLNKRYLHRPTPYVRTPSAGGVLVATVGPDGSGKSTIVRALARWLSWKVDTLPVYFGSGSGPSSPLRWPLDLALRLLRRHRTSGAHSAEHESGTMETRAGHRRGGWYHIGLFVWALALSREKRQKLCRAWLARDRGMVVFCDRFPQAQVAGFNDGPLLTPWLHHRLRLLRALARWERTPYEWAEMYAPDLVLRLHVTPEVAYGRKPEMRASDIRRRAEATNALRYSSATRVVEVDGDGPFEDVLRNVKRAVWDVL